MVGEDLGHVEALEALAGTLRGELGGELSRRGAITRGTAAGLDATSGGCWTAPGKSAPAVRDQAPVPPQGPGAYPPPSPAAAKESVAVQIRRLNRSNAATLAAAAAVRGAVEVKQSRCRISLTWASELPT